MRLVVTATDYEEALRFYRDVLGLREIGAFDDGAGRVTDAGGRRWSSRTCRTRSTSTRWAGGSRVPVAFQVPDAAAATGRLLAAGGDAARGPGARRGSRSTRG